MTIWIKSLYDKQHKHWVNIGDSQCRIQNPRVHCFLVSSINSGNNGVCYSFLDNILTDMLRTCLLLHINLIFLWTLLLTWVVSSYWVHIDGLQYFRFSLLIFPSEKTFLTGNWSIWVLVVFSRTRSYKNFRIT